MEDEATKNLSLSSKNDKPDFTDITIFGTPLPQATSTVERKSIKPSKYEHKAYNAENYKRSLINESSSTHDSSLGILHNISTLLDDNFPNVGKKQPGNKKDLDTERELARRLLQRCSAPIINEEVKVNKENDVNVQNIISETPRSSLLNSEQHSAQSFVVDDVKKKSSIGSASVVFEPREITARSSEMSKTSENLFPNSQGGIHAFSFNSDAAEMMAQFAGEEFKSDAQMLDQIMVDELSWRQNYAYAMPTDANSTEKEHLELSCFSGIIGDFDLSLESCDGQKVSIGEYFKRRGGNIGELSATETAERPSFGFSINSPKKREKLEPLIDITGMTDVSVSTVQKDNEKKGFSSTIDLSKETSVMSLSSIAQALGNIDDATPRKLVDQIMMAKKNRKQPQTQQVISDTYTLLPSTRISLSASNSNTIEAEKLENDTSANDNTLRSQMSKLSSSSKTLSSSPIRNHSFHSNNYTKAEKDGSPKVKILASTFLESSKVKTNNSNISFLEMKPSLRTPSLPLFDSPKQTMKLPLEKYEDLKNVYMKNGSPVSIRYDEEQNSFETKESLMKHQPEENVNKESVSSSNQHSNLQEQIIIGKKTQELSMCVVGIKKETEIDISNKSDRWITCTVSLNQIQGDSEAIELLLPNDVVLVEPNACKTFTIEAIVLKMTSPIIAVLNIVTLDFVTQSRWNSNYIICFISEELQISISTPSNKMELNFETITEDGCISLPVTLENKNCIDLPLFLNILQNEPMTYSIQKTENNMPNADNINFKSSSFVLKSRERCMINIKFQGVPLKLFKENESESLHQVKGKLIIQTQPNSKENPGIFINELLLTGCIGGFEIRIVDTKIPIIITRMQNKLLTFQNSGSFGVLLSAKIVENEDEENEKSCDDFVITPETLFLKSEEKGSFVISYMAQNSLLSSERRVMAKITAGKKKYLYLVIGETEFSEETCDSFRSETPQLLKTMSSPSSPFNRSPNSGRDSPGSSVSGSTIAGDVIPIRATHSSLAWSSVRVGRSDAKEITIRNTSNNKIKLHAFIIPKDQCFKFARERHAASNTLVLTLQASESKTLSVIFKPLSPGAAAGKLLFQHYSHAKEASESRSPKMIPLFGYGGSAKLEISKAYKDTGDQMWLSLGKMTGGTLDAKIKLENLGDLTCYVKLKLIPKAVYPSMAFSWCVEPPELLLRPKEAQWVSLDFRPRKEDLQLLTKSTVTHVGTLKLTYGDEPTRLRIRRLFNKMKESSQQSRKDNEFWNVIYPICKAFPGETFIRDITLVRDSNLNLADLCRGVHQQELKLTVETCADDTMSILQDDMDDTQTFYSLCSESLNDITVTGDSYLPAESVLETVNQNYAQETEEAFVVRPSSINLIPSIENEAIVVISTSCKVAQPFETVLSNGQDYLSVVPSTGMIPTGKNLSLKIECRKQIARDFDAVLRIYTANDKRDVTIRVTDKTN